MGYGRNALDNFLFGISLNFDDGKDPMHYIGFGLLWPITVVVAIGDGVLYPIVTRVCKKIENLIK